MNAIPNTADIYSGVATPYVANLVGPGCDMPAAISTAINAIMAKVRNVEKQGENKFHNYKFARVEDLMFQVQPALAEAGLVITQDEVHHEIAADALMLATYAFSLSHSSGVTWGPIRQTGMASLRNTKGGYDDKALNKCHTAARKYFILGLFQVPAGDLPDADTDGDAPSGNAAEADPRQSGIFIACKAAIDICDRDEAKLNDWKKANEVGFANMDPAVLTEVKRYWQAQVKAARDAAKAAPQQRAEDLIPEDEIPY